MNLKKKIDYYSLKIYLLFISIIVILGLVIASINFFLILKHTFHINFLIIPFLFLIILGVFSASTYLSRKKRLNDKIQFKKTLQKMNALIEKSPVTAFIWKYEQNWSVEYVTENVILLTGYSKDDFLNQKINTAQLIHKDDLDRVNKEVLDNLHDSIISFTHTPYRIITKLGKVKWISASSTILRNKENKITHYEGILLDITKQKEIEQKLIESQQKFQLLSKNMTDYFWIMDTNLKPIYASSSVYKFLGYTEQEILNMKLSDFHPRKSMVKIYKIVKDIVNKKIANEFSVEVEYIHKNGSIIISEINSTLIFDDNHELINIVGVSRDITKRKKTEQELKIAKQKAEESNRLKSAFIANISHEIRTPMNAILGFTDILKRKIIDEENKEYLSYIQSSGNQLLELINEIIDISKIESGRINLLPTFIDISSLLKEIQLVFSKSIQEKKIDFLIEIDQNIPGRIFLDEKRIKQVLINIIDNAIKFTKNGYVKLIVHFKSSQQSKLQKDHINLLFEIQDTGQGIAEKDKERIFDAFIQKDNLDHNKQDGAGLGLTISQKLVKLMGGYIYLTANKPRGSIFYIHLENIKINIAEEAVKNDLKLKNEFNHNQSKVNIINQTTQSIVYKKYTILIVDDMPINRLLLKKYINAKDIHILEAENGKIAVEKANTNKVDLIFMDMRMPIMSGLEAAQKIKQNVYTKNIPIVVVSGSIDEVADLNCKNYFEELLLKPIEKNTISEILKKYLSLNFQDLTSQTTKEKVEKSLTQKSKINYSDLLEQFDKKFKSKWNELVATTEMGATKEFAKSVLLFAEEFSENTLIEWAKNLKKFSSTFDMSNLNITLKQLPDILEKISNY